MSETITLSTGEVTTVQGVIATEITELKAAVKRAENKAARLKSDELDKERRRRANKKIIDAEERAEACLLYTSPSPRDATLSRMPSSA